MFDLSVSFHFVD